MHLLSACDFIYIKSIYEHVNTHTRFKLLPSRTPSRKKIKFSFDMTPIIEPPPCNPSVWFCHLAIHGPRTADMLLVLEREHCIRSGGVGCYCTFLWGLKFIHKSVLTISQSQSQLSNRERTIGTSLHTVFTSLYNLLKVFISKDKLAVT